MSQSLGFFVAALLVALGSEVAPYYVSLVSGGSVQVLGSIADWVEPCSEPETQLSRCTDRYRVPKSVIGDLENKSLGLGIIISATRVSCADSNTSLSFGGAEVTASSVDFLNTYQTISHSALQCSGDIVVDAWSPKVFRRHGHIGVPMVIGRPEAVERVKRLVEFFTSTLPIVLTFFFVGIFFTERVIGYLGGAAPKPTGFEQFSLYWVGFMLVSSGVAQTIFPIVSGGLHFSRASNFFSLMCHVGSGLLIISRAPGLPGVIQKAAFSFTRPRFSYRLSWLQIVVAALCLSPYFAVSLAPIAAVSGALFLLSGFVSRNHVLVYFGLAMIVDTSKHFGFSILPHSRLSMIFALLVVGAEIASRISRTASLARTLRWAKDEIEGRSEGREVFSTLTHFCDLFGIRRASLIEPEESRCRIRTIYHSDGRWIEEVIYRTSLPPIFAHVLSTREPLWHIEEGSIFASNLRKGESSKYLYDGRLFSVIPLSKGSGVVAALGFTDYASELAQDPDRRVELGSAISLIAPILASTVEHDISQEKGGWGAICNEVAAEVLHRSNEPSQSGRSKLEECADIIAAKCKCQCMIMQLNPTTRELLVQAISGFAVEAENAYRRSQFFAVSHNEQGPAALAVNKRKIITVPDIAWLKDVLHPLALANFKIAGTRSCLAAPIFLGSEEGSEVWGLLWLDSREIGSFPAYSEPSFRAVAAALESVITNSRLHEAKERASKVLQGFAPSRVMKRIFAGDSPREEDKGLLLMADIKESTRLSRSVGSDRWQTFTKSITPAAEGLAARFGYSLQAVIWDAFYFTKTLESRPSSLEAEVEFVLQLNSLLHSAMEEFFGKSLLNSSIDRARFCMTFGDTTRDLRSALNDHWTIVGTAMAAVSKLEQACKGKEGWLFASNSVVDPNLTWGWKDTSIQVSGTGEQVFSYSGDLRLVALPVEDSDVRKPIAA